MKQDVNAQPGGEWTDRFGVVASSFCAAHCAICAFAPAAFGALGLGALLSHEAESLFTLVAVTFGVGALVFGWRQHRSARVGGILVLGIVGLLASRGLEMGSGHHDHHDAHHDAAAGQLEPGQKRTVHETDHRASEHGDKHDNEHDNEHEGEVAGLHKSSGFHEETVHATGATVGVLAGMLLFWGHLLNLRMVRKCREECCESEYTG